MNTDQLTYLIEINKTTSMASASKNLHLTPQALSMSIKKLEAELGFSLLNRSYNGTSLTSEGKWLAQKASTFLSEVEQYKQQHSHSEKEVQYSGNLKIYQNDSGIDNSFMGKFICNMYQKCPNLNIQLIEESRSSILNNVLNARINFGIIFRTSINNNYTDQFDSSLIFEPLFDGRLVFMTAKSSELAKFNSISLKKVTQYPMCNYFTNYETALHTKSFFLQMLNLPIKYSNESSFSVFKEKISQGIANACTIQFSVDDKPINYIEDTKILTLRENIKIYFGLVYRSNITFSKNEQYFIQEFKTFISNIQSVKNKALPKNS